MCCVINSNILLQIQLHSLDQTFSIKAKENAILALVSSLLQNNQHADHQYLPGGLRGPRNRNGKNYVYFIISVYVFLERSQLLQLFSFAFLILFLLISITIYQSVSTLRMGRWDVQSRKSDLAHAPLTYYIHINVWSHK